MTLLRSGSNRDLGNESCEVKRAVFERSEFEITRKVAADHAEWNPERIAAHQSWMANQATSIWRIAQLA